MRGGLAFPVLVPGLTADSPGEATGAGTDTGRQLAADAPEPNQNFTPEVRTQSGYEEHEDHEEEEYEDEHGEEEYEDHEEEYEDEHGEEEYEDEHEEEYEENGEEEHEENEGYED